MKVTNLVRDEKVDLLADEQQNHYEYVENKSEKNLANPSIWEGH